jgi:hypothetical protein
VESEAFHIYVVVSVNRFTNVAVKPSTVGAKGDQVGNGDICVVPHRQYKVDRGIRSLRLPVLT